MLSNNELISTKKRHMKEEETRIEDMQRRNTAAQLPLRILQEKINVVIVVVQPNGQWLRDKKSSGFISMSYES